MHLNSDDLFCVKTQQADDASFPEIKCPSICNQITSIAVHAQTHNPSPGWHRSLLIPRADPLSLLLPKLIMRPSFSPVGLLRNSIIPRPINQAVVRPAKPTAKDHAEYDNHQPSTSCRLLILSPPLLADSILRPGSPLKST